MADAADVADGCILVTACIATGPGRIAEVRLTVPEGARVSDMLGLPSVRPLLPDGGAGTSPDVGIWGRRCAVTQPVAAGDRVEVYRPLRVDPMTARRERFRKQGARATGLFASSAGRRSGG